MMDGTATLERVVARKANPNPTVKIDPALLTDIRTVAAFRGESVRGYLDRIIEPIVRKDLAAVSTELARRTNKERRIPPAAD